MTREERSKLFLTQTDTSCSKRNTTAKKVAALLAESAATMPEVGSIFEQAKRYLVVTLHRTDDPDQP